MARPIRGLGFITRGDVNKTLFSKFLNKDINQSGTPFERAKKNEQFLKDFSKLFKQTYGRLPAQAEIFDITKTDATTIKKYLEPGKGYLSTAESNKLRFADISQKIEKGKATRLSKPPTKLSYYAEGPRSGPFKYIPRFVSDKQKSDYLKTLKEKYSVPKGQSKITNEFLAKKFISKRPSAEDVRTIANINQTITANPKEFGLKKKLEFPKQTYEGKMAKKVLQKKRREKGISAVSSLVQEKKIREMKAGIKKVDLAHKASLIHNKALGLPYLATNLGIDADILNQDLVKPFEAKLEQLYKKQRALLKNLKPGQAVPKAIQKQLESLNAKITNTVLETKGLLQATVIDEKTLKPSTFGRDYRNVLGAGLLPDDLKVRDLTPETRALIQLQMPEQIKRQKALGNTIRRALVGAASLTPAGRFARIARFLKKEGGMADENMMVDIKSYDGLDRSTYPSNSMQREALFASPVEDPKQKKRSAILDLELV